MNHCSSLLLRQPTRMKITFVSNLNELPARVGRAPAERVLEAQMGYVPKSPDEPDFVDETIDLSTASAECQEAFRTANANIEAFERITTGWSRPPATDTPIADLQELAPKRAELCWQLSRSYWQIDPFVRPKSYHDRAGLLPPSHNNALNVMDRPVIRTSPSSSSSPSLLKPGGSARASLKSQKSNLSVKGSK